MTRNENDPIWAAVVAAEDEFGEAAEDHARRETEKAIAAGDMLQTAIWDAAAHTLHTLHAINRTWARPRHGPLPRIDRNEPRSAETSG